jgi:ABC-2 type transport system ATP-binding protein
MADPSTRPSPHILEAIRLTRKFGKLTAVDAVSLSVPAGEIFGLLGRNGAGKTTLIKIFTTLLSPTSGAATVAGFDVVRQAANVRRVFGYVPQALSADGELTGYENLSIFATLYDIPHAERDVRIREVLEFMGLGEHANRLVSTYSGGMIRRLEIGQSMLHRPKILFLDEPTLGLDPIAREAVWGHIKRLRADYGTTIFLTTHYMDEAEVLCDRVAILREGELQVVGTLDELKRAMGETAATLSEIFAHFTGAIEESAAYHETAVLRRTAKKLR